MPNLKIFCLECITKDIDENFYIKFIKKILVLNLESIKIFIRKEKNDSNKLLYSIYELKEICPQINCKYTYDIFITKLK